jgi:hypothetical protein
LDNPLLIVGVFVIVVVPIWVSGRVRRMTGSARRRQAMTVGSSVAR